MTQVNIIPEGYKVSESTQFLLDAFKSLCDVETKLYSYLDSMGFPDEEVDDRFDKEFLRLHNSYKKKVQEYILFNIEQDICVG